MHTNMVNLGTLIKPAKVERCKDEIYPVLSMTMHDGLVFQNEKFKKTIASKDTSDYKIVKRNQLVISFPIDEGVLATQRIIDAGIVSPAYGVWDVNTKKIMPLFLEMSLRCNRALDYYKSHLRGSTARRRSLPTPTLLAFTISLPTLTEQQEILNIIDKARSLVEFRKKQLQQLDELVKARFVEMFGTTGNQVPLIDCVWFQEGPGVRSIDFTNNGTILLTGSNINDNIISFGYKSDRHISNELASGKYAHFMCDKDDVLVVSSAIDPEKFDKKVVVVDTDKKYCLNTGIIRFKPNKQYLTLGYFREFLKTDYFKRQVISEMRGIAQMHFGPSHLKQMTILLPNSIEKQTEFESFVKQIDKSKVVVQKALDEAQTLFDSLMQEYFG